jgi:ribosomal protein S18 acetylase RimI-like enzyme
VTPTRAAACTVSPLTPQDIPIVSRLAHCIWPVCYADILTAEQIANMLERIYSEENLRKEMAEGHRFWAAYESDAPVGFASAYKENEIVWLKKLYVLPDRQGRGIGKVLMDAAVAAFLPAQELRLLVHRHNLSAQRFYTRAGFARIGEAPVQMGDFHFVDLVFSKRLSRR